MGGATPPLYRSPHRNTQFHCLPRHSIILILKDSSRTARVFWNLNCSKYFWVMKLRVVKRAMKQSCGVDFMVFCILFYSTVCFTEPIISLTNLLYTSKKIKTRKARLFSHWQLYSLWPKLFIRSEKRNLKIIYFLNQNSKNYSIQ